jgi:eukaryotic-like serine/threonine-protein kinase
VSGYNQTHIMNSCPSREKLTELLRDSLPEPDGESLERHVGGCARCQQILDELAGSVEAERWRRLLQTRDEKTILSNDEVGNRKLEPSELFIHRLRKLRGEPSSDPRAVALTLPQGNVQGTGAPVVGAKGPAWPKLPGYEIQKELGRGGMSVVYLAKQTLLDRLVALKMIVAGVDADPEYRFRLLQEARAVAQLHHPNIVAIYDVGEYEDRLFLSLEYVSGGSLHDRIDRTPQIPAAAAWLVETLARAMHYAHQNGIIHRDLKPANVLLERKLEIRNSKPEKERADRISSFEFRISDFTPKVTDFGVAKLLNDVAGPTRTGAFVGTPSYMAPEQAGGKGVIGPETDVYALGAILYELLTGRPPFWAANPLDTLLQVRFQEPVAPRTLQPAVPRDLETICLKCLQKDSTRRYSSSQDLAEDLRRFQAGEPIEARPPGPIERLRHSVRRHPVTTGLVAALLLAIGTGFAGLTYGYVAARNAFAAEAAKRQDTETRLYFAHIFLSQQLLRGNDFEAARTTLEEWIPEGSTDHRGWEWFYLRRQCVEKKLQAADSNGRHPIASEGTGRRIALRSGALPIDELAFAPEGHDLILFSHKSRQVLRLDPETGNLVPYASLRLPTASGDSSPVTSMALSADGRQLASADFDSAAHARPRVTIWDVNTGRPLFSWLIPEAREVRALAFSPQASRLASLGLDGTMRIWDLATHREIVVLEGRPGSHGCLAFSSNGSRLAWSGPGARSVCIQDAANGSNPRTLGFHNEAVSGVAFSPNNARLVSIDCAGEVRIWDTANDRHALTLQTLADGASTQERYNAKVAFSSNGRQIAATNRDETISIWDAE